MNEKIVFSMKCPKCRCKNAMTEDDVLRQMHKSAQGEWTHEYWFWCCCNEKMYVHEKKIPHKVLKKLKKRFKK